MKFLPSLLEKRDQIVDFVSSIFEEISIEFK